MNLNTQSPAWSDLPVNSWNELIEVRRPNTQGVGDKWKHYLPTAQNS